MNCVKSTKRKFLIRAICLLLGCVMMIACFAACAKGEKPSADTTPSTPGSGNDQADTNNGDPVTPPDDGKDPYAVPVAYKDNFDDYEFRVLTRGSGSWIGNDILGEVTGNIVDQAVFNRNEKLMNQYNFTIIEKREKDWLTAAKTAGNAQRDAYDMWSFKMNDLPALGQEGYLYNLNEVDQLNLNAVYYDQSTREMGSFNKYLFFLTGDMIYVDDFAVNNICFNRNIYSYLNLDSIYQKTIYQLVNDKEWTLAAMQEFCKIATYDNGDGVWDINDNYGFCYQNADLLALNISCGNMLLQKDADDIFYFDNGNEKMITDLENIFNLFNSGYNSGVDWTESRFKYGTQLFELRQVMYISEFKNEEMNFGVLPYPLANSEQEEYHSFISTYGSNAITICSAVKDVNVSASIIELLSYESYKSVTPQLEKYFFDGRVVEQEEDCEMLRLVLSTKTYELCYLWSTGSLYQTMIDLNKVHGEGIANKLKDCKKAVEESVARKLDRLNRLV